MGKLKSIIACILIATVASVQAQKTEQTMNNDGIKVSAFPVGEPNVAYQQYFTGRSWIARLTSNKDMNVPMANVTFEPGCRNNWHSHTGGQILVAVGGVGYYQERGKVARRLLPGDVVEIASNVEHWHGAAPDSWFAHLAIECNPQTNKSTWLEPVNDKEYAQATAMPKANVQISDKAQAYHSKMFPGQVSSLLQTDPEFVERFDNFAFDEVVNHDNLDDRTRFMAILATLIGCQGIDEYKVMLPAALNFGLTPVEVKEIVYQAVDYCGVGRILPFLNATNDILLARGVKLPLEGQATTTIDNRLEKGAQAQVDIFGDRMKNFYKSGPEETVHINRWLAENCFGDYYTRKGLDYRQREMITFCYLAAQGGCEPQLVSHAKGNISVGNDKQFLINVVSQCLPYIGYPRTLNALKCIEEASAAK